MKSNLISWIMLFVLGACGKSTPQVVADAILSAQISLGSSLCQEAIDTLEVIGRQNNNPFYLKTLASAYACRAGYSTVNFFANDLSKSATPSPLGGLSKYSTSKITVQNPLEYDPQYQDLWTAMDLLLYAGGIKSTTEPTATERAKYFNALDLGDMHTELLYLELVTLGLFMKTYANASAVGVKGGGLSGNNCFSDYALAPNAVKTALGLLPGACQVTNSPHPQLSSSLVAATRKRRMCHGIVLLNSIFDLLPAILASATGNVSTVGSTAQTAINLAKTALTTAMPSIGAVLTTMNQLKCEDNSIVPVADIESFYALIMESMIQ